MCYVIKSPLFIDYHEVIAILGVGLCHCSEFKHGYDIFSSSVTDRRFEGNHQATTFTSENNGLLC